MSNCYLTDKLLSFDRSWQTINSLIFKFIKNKVFFIYCLTVFAFPGQKKSRHHRLTVHVHILYHPIESSFIHSSLNIFNEPIASFVNKLSVNRCVLP